MIDIHCHILPLLDDGPDKLFEAVAMAKRAAADGITHIVATSHVNGTYSSMEEDAFQVCYKSELNRLRGMLWAEQVPVGILPGAEVFYANLGTKNLAGLCLNKTRYLLMEFPHTHLPAEAANLIARLVSQGFLPIIAHPERNQAIIEAPQKLIDLRELGALTQITASSLTDTSDLDVKQCALYLIKKDAVDVIATDAHSSKSRPPVLSGAYEVVSKLASLSKAEELMRGNPTAILRGKVLRARTVEGRPVEPCGLLIL